jgi:hypothetical protein
VGTELSPELVAIVPEVARRVFDEENSQQAE